MTAMTSPGYMAGVVPQDTLTSKAARLASGLRELHTCIDSLEQRVIPKGQLNLAPTSPPQPVDHLVFALEAADSSLSAAIERLRQITSTL